MLRAIVVIGVIAALALLASAALGQEYPRQIGPQQYMPVVPVMPVAPYQTGPIEYRMPQQRRCPPRYGYRRPQPRGVAWFGPFWWYTY